MIDALERRVTFCFPLRHRADYPRAETHSELGIKSGLHQSILDA